MKGENAPPSLETGVQVDGQVTAGVPEQVRAGVTVAFINLGHATNHGLIHLRETQPGKTRKVCASVHLFYQHTQNKSNSSRHSTRQLFFTFIWLVKISFILWLYALKAERN